MKARLFAALVTFCVVSLAAMAEQETAPTSSLRLQVKEVGSKRAEKDHWKTDYGSYDRDVTRSKAIEYHVQNFNRFPAPGLKVTAIWVMTDKGKNRLEVSNSRTETFDLPPGQKTEGRFDSPEVTETTLRLAALNETYNWGLEPEGYIVALTYKGEIIDPYGSTERLKAAIRTEWIQGALKEGSEPEKPAPKASPEEQVRRAAEQRAAALEQARQEKLVVYIRNPKLAQSHAIELLPAIGEAGTPENKEFVERAARYRQENPGFFNEPDWPVRLAEEIKSNPAIENPPK